MDVAVYPAESSAELISALDIAGIGMTSIDALDNMSLTDQLTDSAVLIIELHERPQRTLNQVETVVADVGIPVLAVVADSAQFPLIEKSEALADFVMFPPTPGELGLRIRRLHHTTQSDETLQFKALTLNPLTYQAALDGTPLDLTYMEYELLRFFVENQGRVWSRVQLLSKVWGYDYYGGARTVDVHVRRLRAKLGDSRSSWITTVRSVGYRFG